MNALDALVLAGGIVLGVYGGAALWVGLRRFNDPNTRDRIVARFMVVIGPVAMLLAVLVLGRQT